MEPMNRWLSLSLLLTLAACAPPPPAALPEEAGRVSAPERPAFEPVGAGNLSFEPRTVELELAALPDFTFSGSVPGPTIDAREGDRVAIRFINQLETPLALRFAGLAGAPDERPVAPATRREIAFELGTGSAGTYLYRPADDAQLARGLVGVLRVRAENDPLPASYGDSIALIHENADGALRVNGLAAPSLALHPGERRRVRLVNGSPARSVRLTLSAGRFVVVGHGVGLLERPVEQEAVALAPGDRAEVIVTGPAAGDRVEVRDAQALFTLVGEGEPEQAEPLPETLKPAP